MENSNTNPIPNSNENDENNPDQETNNKTNKRNKNKIFKFVVLGIYINKRKIHKIKGIAE